MIYCSKNNYFSNTVQYCSFSMPRLSQTLFSTKSLLLTSTVCSDWPTGTVQCDWPNTTSHVGNVTPLSIIASFSFQNTFTFMHLSELLSKVAHSAFRLYIVFVSMCVLWELNPQPLALLMQCSTTEPQE